MKTRKLALLLLSAVTSVAALLVTPAAKAATIRAFGLNDSNQLLSFDITDPMATKAVDITGVDGTLLGVDFRPANGKLYTVTNTNKIYTIDTKTGAATLESMITPLDFNGGQLSGFDFNPAADALRLVGTNDQNFRIKVNSGNIADFDPETDGVQSDGMLAFADADTNAGVDPNITAVAYTNSFRGQPMGRSTVLYGIDSALDKLVLQTPPNDGTLNTIGDLGFDFDTVGGFDIQSPAADNNTAYATSNGNFYGINLTTGEATNLGAIGDGQTRLVGLATTEVPEPASVAALLGIGALALSRCQSKKEA